MIRLITISGFTSILAITIPLIVNAQMVSIAPPTHQEDASFGYHISQDSDWLLVGAKEDTISNLKSGASYFYKLVNGNWVEWQKVGPVDGAQGDLYGISVALYGKWAVVGADGDDSMSLNSGAAYVYELVQDTWVLHNKFLPVETGIGSSEMGIAVSLKGEVMVVGAYSDMANGQFAGAAYIYELVGDTWELKTKVLPDDGAADDKFGRSVHTDGTKVIICGVLNDDDGLNSGSVYIFNKEADQWVQEAKLVAPDAYENDRFGRSVGIDMNYVAVGSVLDDDNGEQSGSVYIFKNTADGWLYEDKITPADGEADDFFGYALSFRNPYLLVGAHNDDDYGLNSGAAYLFKRDGDSWLEQEKIFAPEPEAEANFGESVWLSEDYLSFGSPYALNHAINTGMVFLKASPMITGLEEGNINGIKVFPNPAQDYIIIDMHTLPRVETQITIHDMMGKQVYGTLSSSFPRRIDLTELKHGVYYLKVESTLAGLNFTNKIIIE